MKKFIITSLAIAILTNFSPISFALSAKVKSNLCSATLVKPSKYPWVSKDMQAGCLGIVEVKIKDTNALMPNMGVQVETKEEPLHYSFNPFNLSTFLRKTPKRKEFNKFMLDGVKEKACWYNIPKRFWNWMVDKRVPVEYRLLPISKEDAKVFFTKDVKEGEKKLEKKTIDDFNKKIVDQNGKSNGVKLSEEMVKRALAGLQDPNVDQYDPYNTVENGNIFKFVDYKEPINVSHFYSKKEADEKNKAADLQKNKIDLLNTKIDFLQKQKNDIEQDIKREKDNLEKEKEEIKNKYNIELYDIENSKNDLEEITSRINEEKIKLNTLEVEEKSIVNKLEDLIKLEEEFATIHEHLKEIEQKNYEINLAKDFLEKAYEKMKKNITPKFTFNLSENIKNITNGKYTNINVNDENGLIVEIQNGEYIPAERLSIGTIDQLYLSLRISMIEEISKEKMPIILDEAFAYFDDERLENILKYLTQKYKQHQLIIFTCTNREKNILDKLNCIYNSVEL